MKIFNKDIGNSNKFYIKCETASITNYDLYEEFETEYDMNKRLNEIQQMIINRELYNFKDKTGVIINMGQIIAIEYGQL